MKTVSKDVRTAWQICLMVMLTVAVIMAPDFAFAGAEPTGRILCTVVTWLTGATGKGIATIGIVILGIGALLGKVSWGMAMIVGIGAAIIFGAAAMVDTLATSSGATTSACSTT